MPDLLERLQTALSDRYTIESEIGRGGMATVFLAEDLKHDRQVAIKVLHPQIAATLGTDRFLREIQIAARLEHPGILPLHDSGEADGLPYYVMPHVEGESLRERLEREGPLPVDEALAIAAEVADGLAYAHEQGVVHRDMKPGNILLSAGHARVADFGVARAVGAASGGEGTLTGLAVGTPKYMSPEQGAGGEVDGRTDVYALGCVLWEILAGEPPFDGPTPAAILARKVAGAAPDLKTAGSRVPADLEGVLARAMAPEPDDRFQTAGELAAALKEPGLAGGRSRRRRTFGRVANAVVAIVLLAAGVWLAWSSISGSASQDEDSLAIVASTIAVLPFQSTGTSEALKKFGGDIPVLFNMKVTGDYGPRTADPVLINQLWSLRGGTSETPLTDAEAIEIAAEAGAGRLVRGVVVGTEEGMSISATLYEVPSGRVRTRQTTVEGPYEDYVKLSDMLINRLLAGELGSGAERVPRLAENSPEAVQAYLRAWEAYRSGSGSVVDSLCERALQLDSTLVLAALLKYQFGETDIEAAHHAWEHRDRLSRRDRLLLRALAGWRFGATPTVVARIAQLDSIEPRSFDRSYELAYTLAHFGRVAGVSDWRERVASEVEWLRNRWPSPRYARLLFALAAEQRDLAAMRQLAPEAGFVPDLRLVLFEGEADVADSLWRELEAEPNLAWLSCNLEQVSQVLLDGYGVHQLDRLVDVVFEDQEGRRCWENAMIWARIRGRHGDWRTFRDRYYYSSRWLDPVESAALRVRDVIFLGETTDSSAEAAAEWLRAVANGTVTAPPRSGDPSPETSNLAIARCWSTLWNLKHGSSEGAAEVRRYLVSEAPLPYRWSVCAGLIEVFLRETDGGDVRTAVMALDSLVRPSPMESPGSWGFRDGTHFVDNLYLSRALLAAGDTAGALEAARRQRDWHHLQFFFSYGLFADLLREEARLAAMVADTAGAVDAYQHYFAVRDSRPDHPPWAAQWDSMRVEYASLTGVETP